MVAAFLKLYSRWFLLCIGLLYSISCLAIDAVILVANSSHFSLLHRIETAIYAQPSPRPQLIRIEAEELIDSNQFKTGCANQCKLIVAVGSQATKAVLETRTDYPILSILIRKHAYDDLIQSYKQENKSAPQMTALYLDQPFERQLNLIGAIIPSNRKPLTVGVLLGPNSVDFEELLEKTIKRYPFKLQIISVKNQDNAIAALDVLLEDVNAIWALPDTTIYNSRTARGLLLSAYRKHVPLIGFSRTYVNNGALAAVYSSPKQIASQTADIIMDIVHEEEFTLPGPRFPDTYSIAVNYQVARSLGIDIESEATLHYSVQQQERFDADKRACHMASISNHEEFNGE
jgi:ABC-type uncharacterized transport system substrate-binding protein